MSILLTENVSVLHGKYIGHVAVANITLYVCPVTVICSNHSMENPKLLEVHGCVMRGAHEDYDISNLILQKDIFPSGVPHYCEPTWPQYKYTGTKLVTH